MHYYQFNISDYKSHTEHLEPLEDLAYRRMLDWCYLHERPLPKDVDAIARLIRMRSDCDCITSVLREFFDLNTDGEYENKRVFVELEKVYSKSSKAKESAKARWAKDKGDANALRTECEGNATQDTRHTTQDTLPKKPDFFLPAEVDESVWADFVQHRKEIRKPLKPLSKVKSANILKALSHEQQRICVDKSIASGWAGLFPDKQQETSHGTHQQDNSAPARVQRAIDKANEGKDGILDLN